MADIRKRMFKSGVSYQVRFPSTATKSGYGFKSFKTRKEAQAFLESGQTQALAQRGAQKALTVPEAVAQWLRLCEKEGLNGRAPVTAYTLENYTYRAGFILAYAWPGALSELVAPDVVAFRSWLLSEGVSRVLASKILSTLQSVFKEMTLRGHLTRNVAAGITIRAEARFERPVVIPSKQEVRALLEAADRLANHSNQTIAKAWARYRPLLYLAADSGMRPQEYLALPRAALLDKGVVVNRAIDGSGKALSVTKTPAGRRYIDLSPEVLDMVRHYAEQEAQETAYDLIFPSQNGRWLCRRNWQRRGFAVACEEAGLMAAHGDGTSAPPKPKYRPYDLRHFFASLHLERGTNLKKLQTLMGHTTIETTLNVYGHLLEDEAITKPATGVLDQLSEDPCGGSVAQPP